MFKPDPIRDVFLAVELIPRRDFRGILAAKDLFGDIFPAKLTLFYCGGWKLKLLFAILFGVKAG